MVSKSLQCAVLSQTKNQKPISHDGPETWQWDQNPGGVHYGPPVTDQDTPNWAITKIFPSLVKQLTLAWQPQPEMFPQGRGVGLGRDCHPRAQQLKHRCCSTQAADHFPGSDPESSLLPRCTSRAVAVLLSGPEVFGTPRKGKKGVADTKIFPYS